MDAAYFQASVDIYQRGMYVAFLAEKTHRNESRGKSKEYFHPSIHLLCIINSVAGVYWSLLQQLKAKAGNKPWIDLKSTLNGIYSCHPMRTNFHETSFEICWVVAEVKFYQCCVMIPSCFCFLALKAIKFFI